MKGYLWEALACFLELGRKKKGNVNVFGMKTESKAMVSESVHTPGIQRVGYSLQASMHRSTAVLT